MEEIYRYALTPIMPTTFYLSYHFLASGDTYYICDTADDKKIYEDMALKDKKRYVEAIANYKVSTSTSAVPMNIDSGIDDSN